MKRVVITGMGLVTAPGHTVEETWEALCQGRSGIGPIRNFDASEYPVRFAGEVRNFDPSRYLEHKEIRRNDPFTHLAVAISCSGCSSVHNVGMLTMVSPMTSATPTTAVMAQ